ncbi:MAG: hypothetical protein ACHP65_02515 [Legionellales bacterium]
MPKYDHLPFYTEKARGSVSYTDRMTGDLALKQLLRLQPEYWIKKSESSEPVPKKLIWVDWGFFTHDEEQVLALHTGIEELIAEKLEVYKWPFDDSYNKPKPLTHDDLFSLSGDSVDLSSIETIYHVAAKQLHLSRDDIFVLDNYWIEQLLGKGNSLKERTLTASNFSVIEAENNLLEKTIEFLQKSRPEVSTIIHDDFSLDTNDILKKLSKAFPNALIKQQYRKVTLDGKQIARLLAKGALTLKEKTLTLADLSGIHSFGVVRSDYRFVAYDVKRLLLRLPALKYLDLTDAENLSGISAALLNTPLASLESIKLFLSNINSVVLANLFVHAPNLKTISLQSCKNLATCLVLDKSTSLNLQHINLANSNITSASLAVLLHAATKVNTIDLSAVNLSSVLILNKDCLQQLEQLNLTSSPITVKNLNRMLELASSLKQINLNGISCSDNLVSNLVLHEGCLPALTTISLGGANLSVNDIRVLIKAAPNLQQIICYNSSIFYDVLLVLNQVCLQHLEKIHLKNPVVSRKERLRLTEDFGLQHRMPVAADPLLKEIVLPALAEIMLESTNLNAKNSSMLVSLMNAAPNLKAIGLASCYNCSYPLALREGCWPALNVLKINGNIDSFILINSLIKAAPNLRAMKLYFPQKSSTPLMLEEGCLATLECLDLSYSAISAEDLKILLQAAPNLTEIRARDCFEILDKKLEPLLNRIPHIVDLPRPRADEDEDDESDTKDIPVSQACLPDAEQVIDADTSMDPNATQDINCIFYPVGLNAAPHVRDYRLQMFQEVKVTADFCTADAAFNICKQGDLLLTPVARAVQVGTDTFTKAQDQLAADETPVYGKQKLLLSNQWQALASLSPYEVMSCYHLSADIKVQIQRSEQHHCYYIRSEEPIEQYVDIDFILCVKKDRPPLPQSLQDAVTYFSSFTDGPLIMGNSEKSTGFDYEHAILEQKKGACRHRAVVFKLFLQRVHPGIPSRIITNDCHAFVEVHVNGYWHSCDLGGYDVVLHLNKNSAPANQNDGYESDDPQVNDYVQQLQLWHKKPSLIRSMDRYFDACMTVNAVSKRLIECNSAQDATGMRFALQQYCLKNQHPVFYIHSADDLMMTGSYVHCNAQQQGIIKPGPGGALYDFLTTLNPAGKAPVLIVNYCNFKPASIVRFNSLLDKDRKIGDIGLPQEMLIIALNDASNPEAYRGSDFYDRLDLIESASIDSVTLAQAIPLIPRTVRLSELALPAVPIIQLYHASNWEQKLTGGWVVLAGMLHYENGALQAALASGAVTVELHNAPWVNKDFLRFWQEAFQSNIIACPTGAIHLPAGFQLITHEGYDWTDLKRCFSPSPSMVDEPHQDLTPLVLNPTCLDGFFSGYRVEEGTLNRSQGFVAARAQQTLMIYLTRTLSDNEWAQLLTECQIHKVQLSVRCAHQVNLPKVLEDVVTRAQPLDALPWDKQDPLATAVIQSSDVETSIALLSHWLPKVLVLDVSECKTTDLLLQTDGHLNPESLTFEFNESQGALLCALAEQRPVILTGRFSAELADALIAFMLDGKEQRLFLINADTSLFHSMSQRTHLVSVDEKMSCLKGMFPANLPIASDSLNKLQARLLFLADHPDADSNLAWSGYRELPQKRYELEALDAQKSPDQARAFHQARLSQVNAVLAKGPYVFLSGPSGVGKSTFVLTYFNSHEDRLLFHGEAAIRDWALDNTAEVKSRYLFIDEANLSTNEFTAFDGLFRNPPFVRVGSKIHPVTDEHKIIFAGNPVSDGGERRLASFFEEHGNAVPFTPFPTAVLYEQILKPVFELKPLQLKMEALRVPLNASHSNQSRIQLLVQLGFLEHLLGILSTQQLALTAPFLEVYRFLVSCSTSEVLISPRELQMMALLTFSYALSHSEANVLATADYFAYHLAKHLVPRGALGRFNALFQPEKAMILSPEPIAAASMADVSSEPLSAPKTTAPDFLITESRHQVREFFSHMLSLREGLRQLPGANPAQQFGGLGGLLLNGEPGLGKTHLLHFVLEAQGYKKIMDAAAPFPSGKYYYTMPVNIPSEQKASILLKAFHAGIIVLIDEINSAPLMESLLNDLLMGITAENKYAEHPGFMLLATQNPAGTRQGRVSLSPAVSRRLLTAQIAVYSEPELCAILESKGHADVTAKTLAKAFKISVTHAAQRHIFPEPTFRSLEQFADKVLKQVPLIETPLAMADAENELLAITLGSSSDNDRSETAATAVEQTRTKRKQPPGHFESSAAFFPAQREALRAAEHPESVGARSSSRRRV